MGKRVSKGLLSTVLGPPISWFELGSAARLVVLHFPLF